MHERGGILSVQGGEKAKDWADIPESSKAGYLREQYWLHKAKDNVSTRKDPFISTSFHKDIPRLQLERTPNDPGDGFLYRLSFDLTNAQSQSEMRWVEVTEVFAHDNAAEVDEVIRRRNNIRSHRRIDVSDFEKNIDLRRPPKALQRRTADKAITAVRKKLTKPSYREVRQKHGSGCLVVGLPLWYATLPLDPTRWANVLDDFYTRMLFGLLEIQRELLDKKECPFDRIVIVWETSWLALEDWIKRCDHAAHSNPASLPLDNPLTLLDLAEVISELAGKEPEGRFFMPLTLWCNTTKKSGWKAKRKQQKNNKTPALEVITRLESIAGNFESKQKGKGFSERVKTRFAVLFLKAFCFFRVHGWSGLEQWLSARLSPLAYVQRWALNWQQRARYRESIRREQARSYRKRGVADVEPGPCH